MLSSYLDRYTIMNRVTFQRRILRLPGILWGEVTACRGQPPAITQSFPSQPRLHPAPQGALCTCVDTLPGSASVITHSFMSNHPDRSKGSSLAQVWKQAWGVMGGGLGTVAWWEGCRNPSAARTASSPLGQRAVRARSPGQGLCSPRSKGSVADCTVTSPVDFAKSIETIPRSLWYCFQPINSFRGCLNCSCNYEGFPGGSVGKESACNAGDLGLIPGVGKIPWRRTWLRTPVFWPEKSRGWRRLVGHMGPTFCRLHGVEKDWTWLSTPFCLSSACNYEGQNMAVECSWEESVIPRYSSKNLGCCETLNNKDTWKPVAWLRGKVGICNFTAVAIEQQYLRTCKK